MSLGKKLKKILGKMLLGIKVCRQDVIRETIVRRTEVLPSEWLLGAFMFGFMTRQKLGGGRKQEVTALFVLKAQALRVDCVMQCTRCE
jgi:hypothetical protein